MSAELGIAATETETSEFLETFSGNWPPGIEAMAWATPYGASVNGSFSADSPFGLWGYGDGRAMSMGHFRGAHHSWELQLKGAGRTPFSRNFDGRAVLRSSVREFLASEAMHSLGVPTTRSLSLVASSQRVTRPWYLPPGLSSPTAPHPPSCNQEERAAVLCRCSPSFWRVGHVELFARRGPEELNDLLWHLIKQESLRLPSSRLADSIVAFFDEFLSKQAELVAEWLRVGYVHGNMNSDNCLLCGHTLDYGPFAFLERFDPHFQPFTSDKKGNYAFQRQPTAAAANARVLAESLPSGLSGSEQSDCQLKLQQLLQDFDMRFDQAHAECCRRKLGLQRWDGQAQQLWSDLLDVMAKTGADFTILFRLLSGVDIDQPDVGQLGRAFIEAPSGDGRHIWAAWLRRYADRVNKDGRDKAARLSEMLAASPKYVARNWMLFEAYEAAERGDYAPVRGMLQLFMRPYDEQMQFEEAFFRVAPTWALSRGGLAYLS
ncbi:selO [Symbiodinium necroappetens]|uniref:Selenoprotein O n=1 Tax=Symbiodinium necroappetens TaxID=1628268 RepID=A0A813CH01_9DINO|nr:selO [Symbiodinium necroappetens]